MIPTSQGCGKDQVSSCIGKRSPLGTESFSSGPSVLCSLPSFLWMTQPSLVTFINKCWKTLDQSRSAPCHQHRWERGPNMWTEPTGIMNKIPVSTHCRLAHPQMPRDHKAVPPHSSWPFLIEWQSKSEESLPPSLLSKLCQSPHLSS